MYKLKAEERKKIFLIRTEMRFLSRESLKRSITINHLFASFFSGNKRRKKCAFRNMFSRDDLVFHVPFDYDRVLNT